MSTANTAPTGQMDPSNWSSPYNAQAFLIRQMLGRVSTATLVQVAAVTNDGGVTPVGSVNVEPLVTLLDGAGISTPHGVLYNLPYMRLQGGANAVILDPQVGDIGIAIFADRDISAVKANKAISTPGSYRRHDMSDGLYIGGFLNGTPVQYVQFTADGISIVSPTKVTVQAPEVDVIATSAVNITTPTATFTGNVLVQGGLTVDGAATGPGGLFSITGSLTATGEGTFNGHTVGGHHHGGVQTGSGNTGTPTG